MQIRFIVISLYQQIKRKTNDMKTAKLTLSELFTRAHKNTRNFILSNSDCNYSVMFAFFLSELLQKKETMEEKFNNLISVMKNTEITKGTEKQINWAKSLKSNVIRKFKSDVSKKIRKSWDSKEVAERNAYSNFIDMYSDVDFTEASFFIDRR